MRLEIDGATKLAGTIPISGAKNAALPCMFATLLAESKVELKNVPCVTDVDTTTKVLESLGMKAKAHGNAYTFMPATGNGQCSVPGELARSMRASILSLGPLLATRGKAEVPLPGGCDFGERPIDIHLWGLGQMGADIQVDKGILRAKCNGLVGANLKLKYPTFTGTENLLMAATRAKGKTVIENAAREPEVAELAGLLNSMGARIEGAGTSTIKVEGVPSLGGANHKVMADRIELGTYLAMVTATGGSARLTGCKDALAGSVLDVLQDAGAAVKQDKDTISIVMQDRPKAVSFATGPHPGFPTDLQAQFMAVSCVARGKSTITETVWANRYRTAEKLCKLGADIKINGNKAYINGVDGLVANEVAASDLRASAALVIAAVCASGTTSITGVHHLQRGYEKMPEKLACLGVAARIIKKDESPTKVYARQNA